MRRPEKHWQMHLQDDEQVPPHKGDCVELKGEELKPGKSDAMCGGGGGGVLAGGLVVGLPRRYTLWQIILMSMHTILQLNHLNQD